MDFVKNTQFELPLKFLKFLGMWIDENSTKVYIAYGIFMHFFFIDSTISMQIAYFFEYETFEDLADLLSLLPTMITLFCKTINLFMRSSKIKEIIKLTQEILLTCPDNIHVEKQIKTVLKIYKIQLYVVVSSLMLVTILSVNRLSQKMTFPFDTKQPIGYALSAIFQSIIGFCSAFTALSSNLLIILSLSYASSFLRVLSDRLESIGKKNSQHESEDKKISENNYEELMKCIQLQKKIDEYINLIHQTFSTVILVQCMMSTLILCTISISLSLVSFSFQR